MTTCQLWPGPVVAGHGILDKGLRRETAARFVWRAAHGPIPPGYWVAQTCRNLGCVNLEHLDAMPVKEFTEKFSGSPAGVNARKSECCHGHPFTSSNTYVTPGSGQRQCRTCKAASDLRRKARMKVNA